MLNWRTVTGSYDRKHMRRKLSLPRVTEPDEGSAIVHYENFPENDFVTLCGLTDWIGAKEAGKPTKRPVTCWACRKMVEYIHAHRKPNIARISKHKN